jgi:hypothetical protein
MRWLLRHRRYAIPGAIVVLAGVAWLAFGYFAVHLLFVDDEVSEPPPVFEVDTTSTPPPVAPAATDPPATVDAVTTAAPATTTVTPSTTMPPIVTEYRGAFVSRNHPTSGDALVLGNGTGQRFLRFQMFETDNGPDLNVYLVNSSAGGVTDYVDLGDLKGNIGDQNYAIPEGVDLETYDTVLIWCVRFASAFGEAPLVQT